MIAYRQEHLGNFVILFKFIIQQVHHGSGKNAIFSLYLLRLMWDGLGEEGWVDEGHVIFVFLYWKAVMYGKGLDFFGVSP